MTDNEVIKDLGICGNFENCKDCSLSDVGDVDKCIHTLLLNSLDLINHQKAEIEKLNKKVEELSEVLSGSINIKVKEIKSDAIKEFADGLKAKAQNATTWTGIEPVVTISDIKDTAKALVGGNDATD